jgi:hypothetical protein
VSSGWWWWWWCGLGVVVESGDRMGFNERAKSCDRA